MIDPEQHDEKQQVLLEVLKPLHTSEMYRAWLDFPEAFCAEIHFSASFYIF